MYSELDISRRSCENMYTVLDLGLAGGLDYLGQCCVHFAVRCGTLRQPFASLSSISTCMQSQPW